MTSNLFTSCWFLTGPTASGKTTIGIELAKSLNAEIIALDSMSIYRNMDIGTAKPSRQQQQEVPHHMIDIRHPDELFSLAEYVEMASNLVQEIRSRGKDVVFVGGTPLYLKSLLRGIFEGPEPDFEFRQQVEQEANRVGVEKLHQRLAQIDPVSAAKLHPNDIRRVIRALEVYRATGQPISHLQLEFERAARPETRRVFVLDWDRQLLYDRINLRVDRMFEAGFVGEVQNLLDSYKKLSQTASQAVGYQEVIAHIQGQTDLPETIERAKTRTRQFAKRQGTWFRSIDECRRIARDPDQSTETLVQQIMTQGTNVAAE